MKKSLFLCLLLLCLGTLTSHAQLKDVLPKASTAKANIGSLLTQFAGALKPTSLLSSWASGGKTNWLNTASKVTDAIGVGKSISSLAGFIKPDMFKSGFNVANLIQAAGTVKTLSSATGLLKNLEGGLKPEALTSAWATQKPAWLSALSLIK
jgi:hypothetical protein